MASELDISWNEGFYATRGWGNLGWIIFGSGCDAWLTYGMLLASWSWYARPLRAGWDCEDFGP
jgi:hypothetical protein